MNNFIKSLQYFLPLLLLCSMSIPAMAQEDVTTEITSTENKPRPVKNTFEGMWIIDNQTVMVPVKGTFEFAIQHRFGTVKRGYDDLYGLYAPSNIRLGFNYTPIQNLMVGFGFTKQNLTWDLNAKYAIFKQQMEGGFPVSLTYFGNVAVDTRRKENFVHGSDRYSYFHQLILAYKFTESFSVQIAPSLSHFNAVESFIDPNDDIVAKMNNDQFSISVAGRYKVSSTIAVIANYDQPLTKHYTNNPNPNIAFGLEIGTSSHTFQVFAGNYANIIPQRNNMFNSNNYEDGEFLIGFNITRLWN